MRKINTSDVFAMARIVKEINIKKEISDLVVEGKKEGALKEQIGVEFAMTVLCACANSKIEDEFYKIVAGITEKTAEDIKMQSLEALVEDFKKIAEENNVVNFFRAAVKLPVN